MCKGRCYAYEELKRQLEDQYKYYSLLQRGKEIGQDRYDDFIGEWKPKDVISEYIRGGFVSSMAIFEAFLADIQIEAFERVMFEPQTCSDECECKLKCSPIESCSSPDIDPEAGIIDLEAHSNEPDSDSDHDKNFDKYVCKCKCKSNDDKKVKQRSESNLFKNAITRAIESKNPNSIQCTAFDLLFCDNEKDKLKGVLTEFMHKCIRETQPSLHDLDRGFSKFFNAQNNPSNFLFDAGPMTYFYPLDEAKYSKVVISDKKVVCAILNLWYGIRCVLAHGMHAKTFESGALKSFSSCEKCGGEKIDIRKDSEKFCNCVETILGKQHDLNKADKKSLEYKVFLEVKRFPDSEMFKKYCEREEQQEKPEVKVALELISKHWKRAQHNDHEYSAEFGHCHMCWVYKFISQYRRSQYFSYRMLLRLNQFILLLAFRIKLAVAKWLSEDKKLPELQNLWGYREDRDYLNWLCVEEEKKLENNVC